MENTSSVEFLLLQEVQFLEVNDELLSQWEFVNVLDSEEALEEEEDDADGDSVPQKQTASWVSSISCSVSPDSGGISGIRYHLPHFDAPKLKDQPDDADDSNGDRRFDDVEGAIDDGSQCGDDDPGGYGGDDYEDTDDYDGYDLDDELVPWSVNAKFGRQRMRKLGKRAFSKMNNSKRSPYLFVRPGCVRGKHGMGLKHNY